MTRRAAVIGCGDISALHINGIAAAGSEVVALCDPDPGRLAAAAPELDVPRYTDHREAFAAGGIDVVHVCTPHQSHVEVTLDAMAAGLPVLTEKPVASTLADAERLIAAAADSDVTVGVCFQNRYNPPVRAAKELLESGRFGEVLDAGASVLWHRTPAYYDAKPWRGSITGSGGGVLINQAIHTVDLVQWLVGDVVSVGGTSGTFGLADTIEVEDTAVVVMTHASGVRSTLIATNLYPHNAPIEVVIRTERALIQLGDELRITHNDGTTETVSTGTAGEGERGYWGVSHPLLITDFHRHLDRGEKFWIDPAEATKSLWILKQVLRHP